MKKILIVIHGMGCGGAEKSLISFLKSLNGNEWNIDLLVMNPNGLFMKDIPEFVNILSDRYCEENYLTPLRNRRKKVCGLRDFLCQIKWQLLAPIYKKKSKLKYDEYRWRIWGTHLPKCKGEYDLAISYMHGAPNYYVIEKVNAKKKILWIHNEFEKIGFNADFEKPYFAKADQIVTISQACVDNFLHVMPEFKDKICVLENISSPKAINTLAEAKVNDPFFSYDGLKLVSVGRLNKQKGFDLAIEAANILKNRGIKFIWYILGEGALRGELQKMINDRNLQNEVHLVGIKANPYPYIKNCNIFVQSSRFEGKSIVLDEAKILCRPIVVTNYVTVGNSIIDGKNGRIVQINANSIAEGIIELQLNEKLNREFVSHLLSEENGNEDEIVKYKEMINRMMEK